MTIEQTSLKSGAATAEINILDDSEEFIYQADANQVMILRNPTGSPISPILTGSNPPSAYLIKGYGYADLTAGFPVGSIAAGQSVAIPLETLRLWIAGSRSYINNGTGLECSIYTRDTVPNIPDLLWIDGGKLISAGVLTVNSKLWG